MSQMKEKKQLYNRKYREKRNYYVIDYKARAM
jgi:hypothetical protein